MIIHFIWIVFMIVGFILTFLAVIGIFFLKSKKRFWNKFLRNWCLFRTLHALGIVFVAVMAIIGQYCPLTNLEGYLRFSNAQIYPEGFIIHFLEKIIYPEVNPVYILAPTYFIAVFSILAYMILPPNKTVRFVRKILCR